MILDHLDWTWPGGRIFIFWSWFPWIAVKDDNFWATVQWPSPLCLEVHRRKVHALDTWRCKINVAFLESKCPGKSARNATSTVFFPPEIYWGIYWEIFDAIFAFDSKDIFSGFTHSLQAEKAWYTQVPKTFRQRPVIFNGRLKMMSNGSYDPRVSWIFLDVCSTFV